MCYHRSLLYSVCIAGLFVSCSEKKDTFKEKKSQAVIVDVIIASQQRLGSSFEVNGTIVANEFVEIKPEVSGLLTYLNVPEGKNVTQGTIIAKINNADLIAQLNKTKVQLTLAETTEQRLKKLLDVNGVNQSDYDAALNQVNGLKADLAITQAQIDKTILKAPFNGLIGLRKISQGAYVTPASILTTLQEVNHLKVDFTVPEEYRGYIQKGSFVNVILDNNRNTQERAQIIATEPQIDVTTRNILVRAVLGSSKAQAGSFVKVILQNAQNQEHIVVPANAIIPDANKNKVVKVKNGKAELIDIETGTRKATLVEITKGLYPGDTIVVTGVLFARPASDLKIRSVKNLSELEQ